MTETAASPDASPPSVNSGHFAPPKAAPAGNVLLNALAALALLYLFLVGVECLSGGIKGLGKGVMDQFMGETVNPMLGLLVGILATTLVQSSSVTTSLIVGLVASGRVPVAAAVPMVMGANIGTTVTNTIASLAHATRPDEFRRAFAAATCHDFFNFLAVAVLLPVELVTRALLGKGFLELVSGWIAGAAGAAPGAKYHSPVKAAFKAGRAVVRFAVDGVFDGKAASIALAVVGVVIIFVALTGIVRVMKALVLTRMERYVNRFLGHGGPVGIAVGIVLTVMVQSSSITTSILVPLAGAGVMTVAQIYPITLGANVGTTITALLASLVVSGDSAVAARQIAIVHLLFNVTGILLFYVPPQTRALPIKAATWLGDVAVRSRKWAVLYVLIGFYGLPAAVFFVGRALLG